MSLSRSVGRSVALGVMVAAAASCRFDAAYRDVPDPGAVPCTEGLVECLGGALTRCENGRHLTVEDCSSRSLVCAPSLLKCTACLPGAATCSGFDVVHCGEDGQTRMKLQTCDADKGIACRQGACKNLCDEAAREHSNVGCEYWAVDLDNAVTSQGNAAAQQYAVVVSNAEPDLVATITVDEDVLSELKSRVGPGEVSAYVVEALRARLQRDPIMELLDKLDEMYGPLTEEEIAEGRREWNEMSERLSLTLEPSSDSPETSSG